MSLEENLKNLYFELVDKPGSKFPKIGKAGRADYIFTCKHCKIQIELMHFHQNFKYRLASHLTRYCNSSSPTSSEQNKKKRNEFTININIYYKMSITKND
jgi:hypothetical protein